MGSVWLGESWDVVLQVVALAGRTGLPCRTDHTLGSVGECSPRCAPYAPPGHAFDDQEEEEEDVARVLG